MLDVRRIGTKKGNRKGKEYINERYKAKSKEKEE